MKNKQLLTLTFLLFSTILMAQKEIDIKTGGNYYFKHNINNKSSLLSNLKLMTGSLKKGLIYDIKKNYTVKIEKIENNEVYFSFWYFDEENQPQLYKTFNNDEVFKLPISEFQSFTKKRFNVFRGVKSGSYSVPIRLRGSGENFEFDSTLSLGANIAGTFGLPKEEDMYLDISFGVSLTQVNLNEDNSSLGKEGSDFENTKTLSSNALTFSFGLVLHPAKNINVGVFYGWDILSGKDQEKLQWVHNKKPWVGLGINVNFTKSSANDTGKGKQ